VEPDKQSKTFEEKNFLSSAIGYAGANNNYCHPARKTVSHNVVLMGTLGSSAHFGGVGVYTPLGQLQ
jgi:hypothetical protein